VKKLILFTFIFYLSGCSSLGGSKGAPFQGLSDIEPNATQIYMYRPSSFVMSLAIPTVKLNSEPAEGVRNGSYIVYELPPGKHKFNLSNNANWAAGNIEFSVDALEGERYFYRLTAHVDDMAAYGQFVTISMGSHLHQVSKEFALQEMAELKFTRIWP